MIRYPDAAELFSKCVAECTSNAISDAVTHSNPELVVPPTFEKIGEITWLKTQKYLGGTQHYIPANLLSCQPRRSRQSGAMLNVRFVRIADHYHAKREGPFWVKLRPSAPLGTASGMRR